MCAWFCYLLLGLLVSGGTPAPLHLHSIKSALLFGGVFGALVFVCLVVFAMVRTSYLIVDDLVLMYFQRANICTLEKAWDSISTPSE